MRAKKLTAILVAILVTMTLFILACSDTRTGPGEFERPPFSPTEGEGWPPIELLNHFGLSDWSRPIGISDMIYIAYSYEFRELNTVTYQDRLKIEFETSTHQTITLIRSYLNRTFPTIEILYDDNWGLAAWGWKWHGNSLIAFDISISSSSGGDIRIYRYSSNGLRQGWPRPNDLAIFDAGGFTQPTRIENQYTFIFSGNERHRLYSRFSGASESFLTHFREYFTPIATLVSEYGGGIVFSKVVGNTCYEYHGFYMDSFAGFEFRRYTTDLPPATGTGWPTSTTLSLFNLGDWTMPTGLEDLTWETEPNYLRIRLDINFTEATEESVEAIRNYLSSKASGSLNQVWWDEYSGDFYAHDDEYSYVYRINFSLSNGGRIRLRRGDLNEWDYSRTIDVERDRGRSPHRLFP
jgi:hypothetical protein